MHVLGTGDRRASVLLRAGETLASSLDPELTLRALVDLVVPTLADLAAIHLVEGDRMRLVAVGTKDSALDDAVRAYLARFPARLDAPHGSGRVARTGEPEVYLDIPAAKLDEDVRDEDQRALLRRIAPRSSIGVPLTIRGETLGALSLAMTDSGRRFTSEDVETARDLAMRAAVALENARLYVAERAAREEADRTRLLLEAQNEASPDGIFFQGADGRTAWYNQRLLELWGVDAAVTQKPTLEERLQAVTHKLADPEAFFAAAKAMEDEPDRSMRLDVRSTDGRIFDCHTAPVRAPDGRRLGRVWYYRDVTAQRAMAGELSAARRELAQHEKLALIGTLVSGIAHEVRTPLAYMGNHAHLLQRIAERAREGGRVDPAAIQTSATAIVEGVDRMNKLVLELRRFSRRSEDDETACDVDEAARAAAHLFTTAHRGRVQLEVAFGAPPAARIEPVHLQQVILNLLENAADASPQGGRVRIETRAGKDGPEIVVRDWGSGIAEDVLPQMWEPFFTTKAEGTGLGLSIVRRILEGVGGTISCESAPGAGTAFTVRLPLA